MSNNNTNALVEALSTKTKQVVIAIRGEHEQHIKVKQGYVYKLEFKDGDVLTSDFALIAKKAGNDLEILLENDTVVIFDNYFEVCTVDLSCFVSLPSKNGVYYVVDKFTTLADGSQIVYFYGDEQALSAIADNQSGLFAQSFSDAFLFLGGNGFFSFLTGVGIGIAAGGGSSDNPNTNPPINADPPVIDPAVIDPPVIDPAADNFAPSASFSDVLEVGRNTDIFKDMSKNFDDVNGDTLTYRAEPRNGGLLPS